MAQQSASNQDKFLEHLREAIDSLKENPSDSLKEVAERIGASAGAVQEWYSGKFQPSVDNLYNLAHLAFPNDRTQREELYEYSKHKDQLLGREKPSTFAHAVDLLLYHFCESHTSPENFHNTSFKDLSRDVELPYWTYNRWRVDERNASSEYLNLLVTKVQDHWGEHGSVGEDGAKELLKKAVALWPGPTHRSDPYYDVINIDALRERILEENVGVALRPPSFTAKSSTPSDSHNRITKQQPAFEMDNDEDTIIHTSSSPPPPTKVAEITLEEATRKLETQPRFVSEEITSIAKALQLAFSDGSVSEEQSTALIASITSLLDQWDGIHTPRTSLEAPSGTVTSIFPDSDTLFQGENIVNVSHRLLLHVILPHVGVDIRPEEERGNPLDEQFTLTGTPPQGQGLSSSSSMESENISEVSRSTESR